MAAAEVAAEGSPGGLLVSHILAAVIFSAVGLAAFCASVWVISKITPFSLRKELEEDQNTAVAIIIGAMILGMSIIIAGAIHG
ncbi:MAG: DUF350 domain-containing protein [Planctomycetia bacterium]|nr:DUF350 domain-containing protein [Planctomycetia bacterium]